MNRFSATLLIATAPLIAIGCPRPEAPPAGDVAVCLEGQPFVADGEIAVETRGAGDADRIGRLRWEAHEGCERLVIDLVRSDGTEAASTGTVVAEVLRNIGVVRVSLHDVQQVDTGATNATFDGSLARSAYAVWAPEGRWTFVDVHLGSEAEAHVMTLADPARVVVDLRPGGGPLPPPPATALRVVVLEPRPGEATYPLRVEGYSRTFEANVVLRLVQGGQEVLETFTTATAWVDAWGHYSFTVADGPTGSLELHVGEYSARDGTWEGVQIDLTMR